MTDLQNLRPQVLEEDTSDVEADELVMLTSTDKLRQAADEGILDKVLSSITAWGRKSSLWPLLFGTACCFVEMAATGAARFDLARFGMELMRASPRQADLMIVPGTVTKKMVPQIVRIYHQMADPKYVISMGNCAISGGPFKEGYNVVSGIDKYLPVDVHVPGCPPRPEALLFGVLRLQDQISNRTRAQSMTAGDRSAEKYPIPLLGPDIIDARKVEEIKAKLKEAREQAAVEEVSLEEAEPAPAKRRPARRGQVEVPALEVGRLRVSGPSEPLNSVAEEFSAKVSEHEFAESQAGDWRRLAQFLKNELQYDFLANISSVDYPNRFEVAYHFYSTGRPEPPIGVNVAIEKSDPVIPSVVDLWQGAGFQEREVYDMMGIRFEGHPDLRRILLWEDFEGFPLRKDYKEPYFEEENKPFANRWPQGHHERAETGNPFGQNVQYPLDWDPAGFVEPEEKLPIVDAMSVGQGLPDADKLVVSFGPQHPSTHGVFRMVMTLVGEEIVGLEPVVGYLHRNHEKIGERNTYIQNMPFTDRLDYICSMSNNLGYSLAVERLIGVHPPERAEYIRIIMVELTRVMNHFMAIGTLLNDLGAFFTPVLYAFEERELILDMFEAAAGSRMMCNYMRFGGVSRDLPAGFLDKAGELVNSRLPRSIDEIDRFLTGNEILKQRCQGVGVLPADLAVSASASGPVLRGSGVKYDIRRAEPYSIYDRFDFEIPVGESGDTYDRYLVRIWEMRESLKILKQALADIPSGEVLAGRKAWQTRVPKGEVYSRIEAPKGELGFYIVSDGGPNPYRYHVRAPSLINLVALEEMCRGHKVADAIAIFGSIDINMGEVDR